MSTYPLFSPSDPTHLSQVEDEFGLTSNEVQFLRDQATAAKEVAYCPYSRFRVGATILRKDGTSVNGANVENAAYPVGTCAERVTIGSAVTGQAGGFKDGMFKALAIATDISPPASPCGMCRQFIREFCALDMPILMFDKDSNFQILRLEKLLPLSFGPEALPPVHDLV